VSKTLNHWFLLLALFRFRETQYLHFTTRVFGHSAITPFLGGTIAEILLLEFWVPPLCLQQACQLISLHYRYTISHAHLIAAHLYRIRLQFLLSNHHPHQSIETRTADTHSLFSLKGMYINPHTPPQVAQAKPRNRNRHSQISSNLSQAQFGTKTSTATTPHHKTIHPLLVAPEHTLK